MKKFIITTDSSCDCAIDELNKKDVKVVFFDYADENGSITDTMDEQKYKKFYIDMKAGTIFKTSQINPQKYYDFFEPLLKENLPIIHVSLGSGVSNTVNNVYQALSLLKEDYPNADIKIIDSKIASLGLTIMINELVELRDKGVDAEEAFNTINDKVLNVTAYYTTDTLTYFARGGRLSKVEAFIGNALKINPVLDCNPAGNLRVVDKIRGSKRAIDQLVNRVKYSVIDAKKQTVLICHADDETRAHIVGKRLVEEVGFKDYKVYFMGPIIGAHTGPGLVAVFFEGIKRQEKIISLSRFTDADTNKNINKNVK